jgi:hypothetical protein
MQRRKSLGCMHLSDIARNSTRLRTNSLILTSISRVSRRSLLELGTQREHRKFPDQRESPVTHDPPSSLPEGCLHPFLNGKRVERQPSPVPIRNLAVSKTHSIEWLLSLVEIRHPRRSAPRDYSTRPYPRCRASSCSLHGLPSPRC